MKPGKIIHLFIAFVLLVSTIGVVINKHYSGGELFSTALFVKAQSCCASSCCHSEPVSGCEEESDYYRLIADYIMPESEINHDIFSASFSFTSIDLFLNEYPGSLDSFNSTVVLIKPPPKIPNLPVLYHSLLI